MGHSLSRDLALFAFTASSRFWFPVKFHTQVSHYPGGRQRRLWPAQNTMADVAMLCPVWTPKTDLLSLSSNNMCMPCVPVWVDRPPSVITDG